MNMNCNYKLLVLEINSDAVCYKLTYRERTTFHVKDKPDGKDISGEQSTSRVAWEKAFNNLKNKI